MRKVVERVAAALPFCNTCAVQLADQLVLDGHDVLDNLHGQRVDATADFHQQRALYAERERQPDDEARTAVLLELQVDATAERTNLVLDHIHAHATPRCKRDVGGGAEPRHEMSSASWRADHCVSGGMTPRS